MKAKVHNYVQRLCRNDGRDIETLRDDVIICREHSADSLRTDIGTSSVMLKR
jgi:exosome complex RNA-binding protein Rrp42 (RNase PH superfamily)